MTLYLFIFLVLLQVADVESTCRVIGMGIGHEANPVMAWLIRTLGLLPGLILPKLIVMVLVYVFALELPYIDYLLLILVWFYIFIVFNNVRIVVKAWEKS